MRSGENGCDLCPGVATNTIRIFFFTLFILFLCYLLIWFNIRKTKESEFSILSKIFTNYLQTVTATMSFNVTFPTFILDLFYPVRYVGAGSDVILSFDCFINDWKLNGFGDS